MLLLDDFPARLTDEQVNKQAAGFSLGVIVGNDRCGGRAFHDFDRDRFHECGRRGWDFFTRSDMDIRHLVQQFTVEGSQRGEHTEFQKDTADELVEIEDAEIGLTTGDTAFMGCQIADLADIVGGHH